MADSFMVRDALDAGMTPQQIQDYVAANGLRADTTGVAARHAGFAKMLGSAHAGQTVRAKQRLTTGQTIAKGFSDMAPPVLSGVGAMAGFMGGAPAGGLPAVPGAVLGGAQGALYGQGLKEAGYNMAGIETDNRPLQAAGRYAGAGIRGMVDGLFQSVGGSPNRGLATSMMKSAVGDAQPLVEEKLLERGIPLTSRGRSMAAKAMADARAQKKALLEWASGPEGMRISWKHFRETLAGATRQAAQADPLTMANENALTRALSMARYKMATIFSKAAKARGEAPYAGTPAGEDAVLTPAQVENIRRYADNQVSYYERLRTGKAASGPTAEPSPLEGAYRAIADRARSILNEITDPATGRSLGQMNKDIGDYADIHKAITRTMKRGLSRDAAVATAATAPSLGAGIWRHDPIGIGLSVLPAAGTFLVTNPQAKSQIALSLARQSAARGAAAQAIPQALGVLGDMSGLGDPRLNRGAFSYTSPDATVRRK